MKFELTINPKNIIYGGNKLWGIQTKERIYNGRIRFFLLFILVVVFTFYSSITSIIIISLLMTVFLVDYIVNYIKYHQLAGEHKRKLPEKYFVTIDEYGFYHALSMDEKDVFSNYWNDYEYIIDVDKEGILFLVDKSGGVNMFFKNWFTESGFEELRKMAFLKIGRRLNAKFV